MWLLVTLEKKLKPRIVVIKKSSNVYRIPEWYGLVSFVFVIVMMVLVVVSSAFLSVMFDGFLDNYYSESGKFAVFGSYGPGPFGVGFGMMSLVFWGAILSWLVEKKIPEYFYADKVQLELRAEQFGNIRGGFFFLWEAILLVLYKLPMAMINPLQWPTIPRLIRRASKDSGVVGGEVVSDEQLRRAEMGSLQTQFWAKLMFFVFFVLSLFWVFGFANTYVRVSDTQILKSSNFDLDPKKYDWGDVEKIDFFIELVRQKNGSVYKPRLIVRFKGEEELMLWSSFVQKTPKLVDVNRLVSSAKRNGFEVNVGATIYDKNEVSAEEKQIVEFFRGLRY